MQGVYAVVEDSFMKVVNSVKAVPHRMGCISLSHMVPVCGKCYQCGDGHTRCVYVSPVYARYGMVHVYVSTCSLVVLFPPEQTCQNDPYIGEYNYFLRKSYAVPVTLSALRLLGS